MNGFSRPFRGCQKILPHPGNVNWPNYLVARAAGRILIGMIVGHGIDLCSVGRIRRMIADHGDHFLEWTFTPAEVAYARRRKKGFEETLAGRFAAKEAVMKALGTGWREGVTFPGIEILQRPGGRPYVVLHGGAAEKAADLGITTWHLSITHTEDLAIASAVAERVCPPACPP